MNQLDFSLKAKSIIIGHAVGDALGVPVEFYTREELDKHPVKDMESYGTYPYPKGTWSDDTSMSYCTLESLSKGTIDYEDIMNNFGAWYYKDEFTAGGITFDVGMTTKAAIENYFYYKKPLFECGLNDEYSNGNGSLMRINPIVLYLYDKEMTLEEKLEIIYQISNLTHSNKRCHVACGIYSFILWELLDKTDKTSITNAIKKAENYYKNDNQFNYFKRVFEFSNVETAINTNRNTIKSSPYVIDSLESAIWCILTTNSYKECVLKAVNLGDDTDSTSAIVGGLAGALYGYNSIPSKWLKVLLKREELESICDKAFNINL